MIRALGLLLTFLLFSKLAWAGWKVDLSQVPKDIQESVLSVLRSSDLNDMSASEVDDLVKLIYLSSQYDPVRAIIVSDQVVQIQISKRVRIASVEFQGLKEMSTSEARRIVVVQEGDVFDPDTLIKQGQNLQDTFKTMGYLNAEVDIEFPTNKEGQVELMVIVRPGSATRIRKIELEIDNEDLRSGLEGAIKKFKNDTLTQEKMKDLQLAIDDFLKTRKAFQASYPSPEISLSNDQRWAVIKFDVQNARQYEFRIEGSSQISSLLSLDDTLELKNSPPGGANVVAELTNRIRNFYLKKGYARIEVLAHEQKLNDNTRTRVTFTVKEGSVIKINKFIFQGKFSRTPELYEKLVLKNASESIQRKTYIKDELDQAVEAMKLDLQNDGYLLAQIVSSRVTYNSEKDRVNVLINLDEGFQTFVKEVKFVSATAFSEEQMQNVLGLKPGEPLRLTKIEDSIRALRRLYTDNGYLEMMVLNEKQDLVQYNDDNSQATLVYKIFEGPQVRVQSIVIEGLKLTQEFVVRFELDFAEGELLTPNKIDESTLRLQRTGYFSSVDIRTVEEKTEVANRTVLIRVTEDAPGDFLLGVGVTNEREFTVRGYLGVGYRNLGGTGRGVSFRMDGTYNIVDIKYLENRFTAGYLEPFLFNTRYKGRFNITRSNAIFDFENLRASLTTLYTGSVERNFNRNVTGIWDVSNASSEDFNIRGPRNRLDLVIGSTGLTFDFDYRDNLVRPRNGSLSRLNVEYGSPALGSTKTIAYVRGSASYTNYTSFSKERFTWSNGLRVGYLQNVSDRDDGGVPYDKKGFFLGGPSTIRGFDPTREAFPDPDVLNQNLNNTMTRQTQMYLIRSTLTYPIWGLVDGSIFYDGGEVRVGGLDLGFGYRSAAGLGILVNTPVGPLNLELGWKIGRLYEGEVPSVFHLSFGIF